MVSNKYGIKYHPCVFAVIVITIALLCMHKNTSIRMYVELHGFIMQASEAGSKRNMKPGELLIFDEQLQLALIFNHSTMIKQPFCI